MRRLYSEIAPIVLVESSSPLKSTNQMKNNFWKYFRNTLDKQERVIPEFNEEKCFNLFSNKAKAETSSKSFPFPPWLDT